MGRITYKETTQTKWNNPSGFAADLKPPDKPVFLHLAGPCPRCKDPMDYDYPLVTIQGVADIGAEGTEKVMETLEGLGHRPRSGDTDVDVICACIQVHTKDKEGCGAYCVFHATWGAANG